MKESQAVQTASNGSSCRQCGTTLPERPSAKQHHFCNAKCRAAWHRGAKQRALNHALELVRTCIVLADQEDLPQPLPLRLSQIAMDLVQAGAEPS